MLNGKEMLTFSYKGEEFKFSQAHIYLSKEKSISGEGLTEKSFAKVRIPERGVFKTPPVGARTYIDGESFMVLLVRENFKGKHPHIYLELRS